MDELAGESCSSCSAPEAEIPPGRLSTQLFSHMGSFPSRIYTQELAWYQSLAEHEQGFGFSFRYLLVDSSMNLTHASAHRMEIHQEGVKK